MKKLLAVLIVTAFTMPSFAADKKPVLVKTAKVQKKHQRFDGTKVADDKPSKSVAKKK